MAARKPTAVPASPFSTTTPYERFLLGYSQVIDACLGSEIKQITEIVERAEADAAEDEFKAEHGMSRQDWDRGLSLHLHGDLQ